MPDTSLKFVLRTDLWGHFGYYFVSVQLLASEQLKGTQPGLSLASENHDTGPSATQSPLSGLWQDNSRHQFISVHTCTSKLDLG